MSTEKHRNDLSIRVCVDTACSADCLLTQRRMQDRTGRLEAQLRHLAEERDALKRRDAEMKQTKRELRAKCKRLKRERNRAESRLEVLEVEVSQLRVLVDACCQGGLPVASGGGDGDGS